jgi:hypothetical protein
MATFIEHRGWENLHALMLNGVGREVHDADVVTVDESALRWRSLELM